MSKLKSPRIGTLSPEMALLGQLYMSPAHGYDLHRKVLTDLGQVWHLSQSQAYSILHRLEAQGDILGEAILQDRLPSRQLFKITNKGTARFLAWLETPSGGSVRVIRMEFVTRLYFFARYFPEKISRAFDRQRAEIQKQILRLEKSRDQLPKDQICNLISLDMRLKQLTTALKWLDESQPLFGLKPS